MKVWTEPITTDLIPRARRVTRRERRRVRRTLRTMNEQLRASQETRDALARATGSIR